MPNHEDRLRQKALMYVFGKRVNNIVDVHEDDDDYYVRYERVKWSGQYHFELFEKGSNGFDKEISDALAQLNWIAQGNEFPT